MDFIEPTRMDKAHRVQMDLQKTTHMEGNVITYKARLVAKGYRQR